MNLEILKDCWNSNHTCQHVIYSNVNTGFSWSKYHIASNHNFNKTDREKIMVWPWTRIGQIIYISLKGMGKSNKAQHRVNCVYYSYECTVGRGFFKKEEFAASFKSQGGRKRQWTNVRIYMMFTLSRYYQSALLDTWIKDQLNHSLDPWFMDRAELKRKTRDLVIITSWSCTKSHGTTALLKTNADKIVEWLLFEWCDGLCGATTSYMMKCAHRVLVFLFFCGWITRRFMWFIYQYSSGLFPRCILTMDPAPVN